MTENTTKWLEGKRGLIMGVANDRSIAWGISKRCMTQAQSWLSPIRVKRSKNASARLAESVGSDLVLPCDVTDEASIDAAFAKIGKKKWGEIDFVVHAIAFSDKNELDGMYVDTTRDNFLKTMDISVYSFTSVAKKADAVYERGWLTCHSQLLWR